MQLNHGPAVSLTVDDCRRDDSEVLRRLFNSAGFKGVFYVIAEFVGHEIDGVRFLEWETLREMITRDEHEIGSHSLTHRGAGLGRTQKVRRMLTLARNEGIRRSVTRAIYSWTAPSGSSSFSHLSPEDEIKLSKRKIEERLSAPCLSYAYPGGGYNDRLKDIVRTAGYSSGRTGYSGYNSWSKLDNYALRVKTWDNKTTSLEANSWVDKAIEKRLWLIELFHAVDDTGYLYSCSRKALEEHLDYMKNRRREIEVITTGEDG